MSRQRALRQGRRTPEGFAAFGWYTFSPLQIAGCVLWLRSDLGITLNGSNVSAWADQSSSGHSVAQGTAGAQPPYTASDAGYNGYPSLSFDGATKWLTQLDTLVLAQPSTLIVVGQTAGGASAQQFIDSNCVTSPSSFRQYLDWDGAHLGFGTSDATGASTSTSTTKHVNCGVFSGAASAYYLDNSQSSAATLNSARALHGIAIGAFGNNNTPSAFLNGKIVEVLIYNSALGPTLRQPLFAYLGGRYGIAVS